MKKNLLPVPPESFRSPSDLPEAASEGNADRPNHNAVEGESLSIGGVRALTRPQYPLPRDPHATPGPDAGEAIDSRFNEVEIANDTASRRARDVRNGR